ncbi:tRNA pseudouridine38/39 synthase [Apostasia shenzhenica]|uniref:tRNA pseudouridine38/39 synthase n=1 Tax=Apostasia shenzhenica TaxID=1088818 RepID=A0A2I0A6Z3_9ASPA|nr:tRNA pseudouridine38/39 synthase [Apostasia shenzhenica]
MVMVEDVDRLDGGPVVLEALDSSVEALYHGHNFVSDLSSQVKSLRIRIQELERENEMLLSQISSCRCTKVKGEEHFPNSSANSGGTSDSTTDSELRITRSLHNCHGEVSITKGKVEEPSNSLRHELPKQPDQLVTLPNCAKRCVALKILYFGQRFYGFASEAQMEPTVESEVFKALERTKLLVGKREDVHYSRCGRTDKGVSATGQVIALCLRSRIMGREADLQEGIEKERSGEIDYVLVLNRALPKDIRVIGWSPVSLDFSARFSCLSREYRYLFWRGTMDVTIMQRAAKKFTGEHDFRNFCKMDAINVNNYRRHITEFQISPCNKRFADEDLWAITIKGSAFLWHQVRCMISVLFMIGQGLESPNIIDVLLDVNMTPRKPQYTMASELPLILRSCEFESINFICSSDARRQLHEHLNNEQRSYLLRAAIIEEAMAILQASVVEESSTENHKKKKGHISLNLRPTEPSYEERRAKWAAKGASKMSGS